MKEKLMNNLTLKLLSIGLAFLIWLGVLYVANPIETLRVRVNVEVLNEDVLTKQAKTYDIGDLSSAYVEVNVRKLDRELITADSFRATIDLSKIYDVTSAVPITVDVVKNQSLMEGEPVAIPKSVMVKVEGVVEKQFDLEANIINEPASGYTVGEISIEPKTVLLKGAESIIGQISSVGIEVDVSEAVSDLNGEAEIICYDANHNPLKMDLGDITSNPENIAYNIKVLTGKSLPLEYEVSGEPAKGYKFVGAESMTKSIAISGSSEAIESISGILIPKEVLNVNGLTANKTVTVDIDPYLPEGVVVEGSNYIDVVLKIEAKSTQSITLNPGNITFIGRNSKFSYEIIPSSIVVNVSGLNSDVSTVNANSLGARIYVGDLSEGSHPGSITFNNPDNIEIDSHSPFVINVRSTQESTSLESSSQTTAAESTDVIETSRTSESKTESDSASDYIGQESTGQESSKQETSTTAPNDPDFWGN